MEAKTKPSLLSLPTELLDVIFSFLKPRDIRIIRRVNKRLNEVANQSVYCENEIFQWNEVNINRPLVKLLNRSNRSVFNLHFDSLDFKDDSLMPFFHKRGSKVHSLSFNDCNFPRRLLQNIIFHCTSLRSFSYITSENFYRTNKLDGFGKFETRSIVREEVTSLTFVIGRLLRNDMNEIELSLRRFMSIFPNVIRLDIRIPNSLESYKKSRVDNPDYESDPDNDSGTCDICATRNRMKSAAIYNSILHMSKTLQWLRTDLSSEFLSEVGVSFFEALTNLNNLSWDLEDFRMGEIDVSKWRTPVQRFPWSRIENRTISMANIVQKLNPKHFVTKKGRPRAPNMDSNFFFELLRSEMQILEFTHKKGWTADPIHLLHPSNTTLTDLNISAGYFANDFTGVDLFPMYFRALVHLRLEMASNEILQLIFENQKNLRSLYLKDCRTCDLDGFTGAKNRKQLSIGELQNLEHLTIKGFNRSILYSRHFNDAFHFPRLKYLNFEAEYDYNEKKKKRASPTPRIPIALFESMENIEALRLSNLGKASIEELKTLCQNLKNLRYLEHDCSGIDPDSSRVCIVDLSESTFKDLNLGNDQCYYDEIMKKIVLTNKWAHHTLFSPKISSFIINWIKF